MKRGFSDWMVLILVFSAIGASAQSLNDAVLTQEEHSDRTTYSLEFPLAPGGLTRIEKSDDLVTWSPQAYWWGFRTTDVAYWPLFSVAKPDPLTGTPQVEDDPDYVPPTHVTLLLEFSDSGLIANWTSLDDTNEDFEARAQIRYQFNFLADYENLWNLFPLYAEQYGDFYFMLLTYRSESAQNSIIPPYNPSLGLNDSLMVAELLRSLPLIEDKMEANAAAAQNAPPPPPPSPDSKGFWRTKLTDASLLDSDNDGLSNQWEIDNGTNWMSVDTDLDGLTDDIDSDPLINEALVDPDGANHGSLNDHRLIGRWDLEFFALENVVSEYPDAPSGNIGVFPSSVTGQVGLRIDDPFLQSSWDGFNNPSGMPSRAVSLAGGSVFGLTGQANLGSAAQLPSSLLSTYDELTFSFWLKLPEELFTSGTQIYTPPLFPGWPASWSGDDPKAYALLSIGERDPFSSNPSPAFAWVLTPSINVANVGQTVRTWTDDYELSLERWQKNGPSATGLRKTQLASWTIDSAQLADGGWNHLALSLERGSDTKAYHNGVELSRTFLMPTSGFPLLNFSDDIAANTTFIEMGRLYPDDSRFTGTTLIAQDDEAIPGPLEMRLDRVRVYSSILPSSDVDSLYNTDVDRDGLLDRNEAKEILWRDLPGPGQTSGDAQRPFNSLFSGSSEPHKEYFYTARPFYADPADADHDDDGLTSLFEQNVIGSNMGSADTDGDFIPDKWEYDFLGALAVLDKSSANQNSDGDSLLNIQEYEHQTDPLNSDTDGDLVNDDVELLHGSFPDDISDGGLPVADENKFTMTLTVGDQSGSQSESYEALVHEFDPETGEEIRIAKVVSGQIAQVLSPRVFELPLNSAYSVQLKWLKTNNQSNGGDGPDYDYTFDIEITGENPPLLIEPYDPTCGCLGDENITGSFTDRDDFVQTVQNKRVLVPEIRVTEFATESGFDDFERREEDDPLDFPWLMIPGDGAKPAKCKVHGLGVSEKQLECDDENIVLNPEISGASDPFVLSHQGVTMEQESFTKVSGGPKILNLAIYPRKTFRLKMHVITLPNDDVDMNNVEKDKGLPDQICIAKNGGVFHSLPESNSDDDFTQIGETAIHNGPNGICETEKSGTDSQVIPVGQGKPNVSFISAGLNGVINTKPEGDDEVSADGLFITTGLDGIRDTNIPESKVPMNVPTKEELESTLNRIYGNQVNIYFEVIREDITVNFDVGHTDSDHPDYEHWGVNNELDFFLSTENQTQEEEVLIALENDEDSGDFDFHVYYVPARIRQHLLLSSGPIKGLTFDAIALENNFRSYIDVTAGLELTPEVHAITTAHEVGHFRFPEAVRGLKHPYDFTFAGQHEVNLEGFPLKDFEDDKKRLMFTPMDLNMDNRNPENDEYPSLLIKPEWDILHGR